MEFDTFRQNSTVFGVAPGDNSYITPFIIMTYVILHKPVTLGFVEFGMGIFITFYQH